MKKLIAALATVAAFSAQAAETLTVAATAVPHAELLEFVKPQLAEQGVTLEVCPGSNVALGLYPDWPSHPIARLADAGCRVTVSTDDPPFFDTTLSREYDRLAGAFGWGEAEFARMNHWALDAAFCDAATRARLRQRLPAP